MSKIEGKRKEKSVLVLVVCVQSDGAACLTTCLPRGGQEDWPGDIPVLA